MNFARSLPSSRALPDISLIAPETTGKRNPRPGARAGDGRKTLFTKNLHG
jgi:hypothetical protein